MNPFDELLEEHPNLERLINAFSGISGETADPLQIVLRLLAACVIGWLIGQVYKRTFTGRQFSPTLPDTHMLLCLGGAIIWLVVSDNLVRAFGLAGTIGLIRYRTIVRDPKDTTILLFSMVLGMACGLGAWTVAIYGSVIVLLVLVVLHRGHRNERFKQARESTRLLDLLGEEEEPPRKRQKPAKDK